MPDKKPMSADDMRRTRRHMDGARDVLDTDGDFAARLLANAEQLYAEVRRLQGREEKLAESLGWAMAYLDKWIVDDDMCDFCHRDKRTEKHKPTCPYRRAKEVLKA